MTCIKVCIQLKRTVAMLVTSRCYAGSGRKSGRYPGD